MSRLPRPVRLGLKTVTGAAGVAAGMGLGYGIEVVRARIQSALYPKFWAELRRTRLALDTVSPGASPQSKQPVPIRVTVLGDSAASGVGASHPEKGYVGLLMTRLEEVTGRQVELTNISVPGASSWLLMEHQLPQLRELEKADITLSVIGANDLADPRYSLEGFTWTAHRLYPQLPPGTVVSTIPSFGFAHMEAKIVAANAVITQLAAEYDLELGDLFSHTKELGLWRYLFYTSGDMFHPSERGYVVWAAALWPALQRAAKRAGVL